MECLCDNTLSLRIATHSTGVMVHESGGMSLQTSENVSHETHVISSLVPIKAQLLFHVLKTGVSSSFPHHV